MVSNTVNLDIGTSDGKIYGYTALIGTGTGVYFTAGFAVAQGVVPASELSNSVGFMAIGQMLGQVTILLVADSLYQNTSIRRIQDLLPNATFETIFQLTTGRHSEASESLTSGQQEDIIAIITVSIRNVFGTAVSGAAIGLLASILMSVRSTSYFACKELRADSGPKPAQKIILEHHCELERQSNTHHFALLLLCRFHALDIYHLLSRACLQLFSACSIRSSSQPQA